MSTVLVLFFRFYFLWQDNSDSSFLFFFDKEEKHGIKNDAYSLNGACAVMITTSMGVHKPAGVKTFLKVCYCEFQSIMRRGAGSGRSNAGTGMNGSTPVYKTGGFDI